MGVFLNLDDMNMRGSQIAVAYSDYAGRDVQKFIAAVNERDSLMVAAVNEKCAYTGEIAVTGGASLK